MRKILNIAIAGLIAGMLMMAPVYATDDAVVTSAGEDEIVINEDDSNVIKPPKEIDPTFVSESSESEESVRLWAGKNLLVAGNNVNTEIKAPAGLMLMAGNNLNLRTESEYGFLFGNNITFAGSTTRDLYIAGNSVSLKPEARIGRDVFSTSADLLVEADLPGDLSAVAVNVELKDVKIAGNLNLTADEIRIRGKVEVAGKFTYNDNARVSGLENLVASETETFHVEEVNQAAIVLARIYTKLMSIAALFLAMAIIFAFCPRLHRVVERTDTIDRFGNILVKGLGVFIAFPLVAILAFLTYVAAPLGIIAILLYIVLIYLSQGFAGLWVGHMIVEKIFKSKAHVLIEALVGIVVLGALALIPYVGVLTGFLGVILGLGLMLEQAKSRKTNRIDEITEAEIEQKEDRKKED